MCVILTSAAYAYMWRWTDASCDSLVLIRPTSISSYDVTSRPFLLGNVKATSQIEASKPVGIWQVENDNSDTSKPPWSLLQCSDVTTCVTSKYDILKAIFDINQLLLKLFSIEASTGRFRIEQTKPCSVEHCCHNTKSSVFDKKPNCFHEQSHVSGFCYGPVCLVAKNMYSSLRRLLTSH